MKLHLKTSVAVLILLISWASAHAGQHPSLNLTAINGKKVSLNDYKGKVVLLNFWATWCAPCRQEIPDLIKWQRDYQNRGLQIIGIAYPPQETDEVVKFNRQLRMNYPIAIGTKETKALFTSSETLPVTVVIDREGNVSGVIEGIVYADEFNEKVKPLLAPVAAPPSAQSSSIVRRTITITRDGYQPSSVKLRRGVRARLVFIRRSGEGCGTEIVIPAYGINRPLPLNVPVAVTFTPRRGGRYKFTCGMDMFRGMLIVR